MVRLSLPALIFVAIAGTVVAHPGHDVQAELERRIEYAARPEYRSLSHCEAKIKARDGPRIQSRVEQVDRLREKRGIQKRGYIAVLKTDHESDLDVTPSSDDTDIFGSTATCVLQDEVTEGPYCTYLTLASLLAWAVEEMEVGRGADTDCATC